MFSRADAFTDSPSPATGADAPPVNNVERLPTMEDIAPERNLLIDLVSVPAIATDPASVLLGSLDSTPELVAVPDNGLSVRFVSVPTMEDTAPAKDFEILLMTDPDEVTAPDTFLLDSFVSVPVGVILPERLSSATLNFVNVPSMVATAPDNTLFVCLMSAPVGVMAPDVTLLSCFARVPTMEDTAPLRVLLVDRVSAPVGVMPPLTD